jgi:hypothetical protein
MAKRVHWDDDQIESLAQAFVRVRLQDPIITVRPILRKVQEETLEFPYQKFGNCLFRYLSPLP